MCRTHRRRACPWRPRAWSRWRRSLGAPPPTPSLPSPPIAARAAVRSCTRALAVPPSPTPPSRADRPRRAPCAADAPAGVCRSSTAPASGTIGRKTARHSHTSTAMSGTDGGRFQPGNLPDEQTIYCGVAAKARFSLHFPPDACSEAAAHCGNPGTGVPRARSYRGSQARCWRGGGRRTAEVARPCSSQRRGACHENNSRASVTKKTTHRVDKCGWARTWEHNLRSPQLHFFQANFSLFYHRSISS